MADGIKVGDQRTRKDDERVAAGLPLKHVTDVSSLPLAHDELHPIRQGDEPTLAAHATHFPDLLDVDESIPMNTTERAALQTVRQCLQILSSEKSLFRSNDPSQITIGLKG